MKANEILEKARIEIRDFILYELNLLYSVKKWEKNEFGDMEFEFSPKDKLVTEVWVSDYEGNDYKEERRIERLVVSNDEEPSIYVELEDGREYYSCELDLNLVAKISNIIERDYKETIK